MFLWFVGTAIVVIWFVFGDPRFDYRFLIIGSLAPSAIDIWSGGRWVMHTLAASVVLLCIVMVATIGRRQQRRSLLGLPLGVFLHLVATGAWLDPGVFWWPFSGAQLGVDPLPEFDRGWWNLAAEVIGAALVVWVVVTSKVYQSDRWRDFLTTGRLQLPVRR